MNIGVIGLGIVGSSVLSLLENNEHTFSLVDPATGDDDSLNECEAVFVCVPVPESENKDQDTSYLEQVFDKYLAITEPEIRCPIFIRSTILPNTCKALRRKYLFRDIYHLPEFLTERTCYDDVKKQKIYGPREQEVLLKKVFGSEKVDCNYLSEELELAKYAHNCFGALKVSYFNMIYDMCQVYGLSYDKTLEVILGSGYINDVHTKIALDGKRGWGGKCFPSNVKNFKKYTEKDHPDLSYLLNSIDAYNDAVRSGHSSYGIV